MSKKLVRKLGELISFSAMFGMATLGLLGFQKPAQAVTSPIYVQVGAIASSAWENFASVPVSFIFSNATSNNAPHDKIDIYYQITGTANTSDYVFNNQPNTTFGVIHVPAGQGAYVVNLQHIDDSVFESDETVIIQIVAVYNRSKTTVFVPVVQLGADTVFTHTIWNDDVMPLPASLNITQKYDASTISKIYSPDLTFVQLGKWKFSATNQDIILNKLTLQTVNPIDNSVLNNLGTFSLLALYEGNNFLGTANYNPVTGAVVFNNFSSTIPGDNYKIYTLRGYINASGTMTNNVPVAFVVKSDSNADMEARTNLGQLLGTADINYNASTNVGLPESRFAQSTVYIYHDAVPVINSILLPSSLPLDAKAKIFKFSVRNSGTVDLRMSAVTVSNVIFGLVKSGSVSDFKLYEDDGTGVLPLMPIAQNNGLVDASTPNPVMVLFDKLNLVVAPGATKTLIVTADTTNMINGLATGSVGVVSKIAGSTGWNGTAWNTGDLVYYYAPIGHSEQGQFSASDSYEVDGNVLVYSL